MLIANRIQTPTRICVIVWILYAIRHLSETSMTVHLLFLCNIYVDRLYPTRRSINHTTCTFQATSKSIMISDIDKRHTYSEYLETTAVDWTETSNHSLGWTTSSVVTCGISKIKLSQPNHKLLILLLWYI